VVNFTSRFSLPSGNHKGTHRTGGLVWPQSRFGWFGKIVNLFPLQNSNRDLSSQLLGDVPITLSRLLLIPVGILELRRQDRLCELRMKSSLMFAYADHSPVSRGMLLSMYRHVCKKKYQLSSWNIVTNTKNKICRTETGKS